jgi:hypothetical protein
MLLSCVERQHIEPGKQFRGKVIKGWFIPMGPTWVNHCGKFALDYSLMKFKETLPHSCSVAIIIFQDGSEQSVVLVR